MPYTPTQLEEAIANIKDTTSGKVEYNDLSASLRVILAILQDMSKNNMIFQVEDIAAMQAVSGAQANFLQIQDAASGTASSGIYTYRSTGTADGINSFNATGGGIWKKANLPD